jgi:hypothetical protein
MKSFRYVLLLSVLFCIPLSQRARAHDGEHSVEALAGQAGELRPGHSPGEVAPSRPRGVDADASRTSGQGEFVFCHDPELSALPEPAIKYLRGAHGGFAVDWRGQREVYFALKGCGVIRMSADLRKKEVVELDPYVRQGNFHNTSLIYDGKGTPYLALPDNEKNRVYITSTSGELFQVLSHPRGNPYYDGGGAFVPTDVEQSPQLSVYIVTGYSRGDFVVSADPFRGTWNPLIFGGKGKEHGKFGTGHGITWNPWQATFDISDRPNSRIESFSTDGKYRKTVALPRGCLPCDIDFLQEHAVVGCLKGPDGGTPAPIYILDQKGAVVSTIKPKEELGLDLFTHLHNVTWHVAGEGEGKKVYLLCQAWNPGGFAVLERVSSPR